MQVSKTATCSTFGNHLTQCQCCGIIQPSQSGFFLEVQLPRTWTQRPRNQISGVHLWHIIHPPHAIFPSSSSVILSYLILPCGTLDFWSFLIFYISSLLIVDNGLTEYGRPTEFRDKIKVVLRQQAWRRARISFEIMDPHLKRRVSGFKSFQLHR